MWPNWRSSKQNGRKFVSAHSTLDQLFIIEIVMIFFSLIIIIYKLANFLLLEHNLRVNGFNIIRTENVWNIHFRNIHLSF